MLIPKAVKNSTIHKTKLQKTLKGWSDHTTDSCLFLIGTCHRWFRSTSNEWRSHNETGIGSTLVLFLSTHRILWQSHLFHEFYEYQRYGKHLITFIRNISLNESIDCDLWYELQSFLPTIHWCFFLQPTSKRVSEVSVT